ASGRIYCSMSSDSTNQVLIADKRLRRRVLGLAIVLSGLGLAAIYALEQFLQDIQELAKESPEEALEQFGPVLSGFLVVTSLCLILVSGWVARLSFKALQAEQFPPPGTRVIRDTRVICGAQARRKAILGLVLAAVLAVCSVLSPWWGWSVYQMLAAGIGT
ncbi:MAG: hypothetical protein MJA27_15985, partial [Pseudanabaenales cyanobacterium]|nr:hypothetical protein [Pseudanabaenales cyanobacterium]